MQVSQKPTIRIIHNLARSGGTLVGKCFGCMKSNALLSEVHPDAQKAVSFNVIKQAQNWFNLDPSVNWQKIPFLDALNLILHHCQNTGQQLILRDWSHVDYFGFPVTKNPKKTPALIELLEPHFNILSVQLLRNPLDTWESFKRLNLVKASGLNAAQFIDGYARYEQNTRGNFQLFYEDFLEDPNKQLRTACEALECEYDAEYISHWFDFSHITGDQCSQSSLRKNQTISPRPNKVINKKTLQEFSKNPKYHQLLKLLPQYDVIECKLD